MGCCTNPASASTAVMVDDQNDRYALYDNAWKVKGAELGLEMPFFALFLEKLKGICSYRTIRKRPSKGSAASFPARTLSEIPSPPGEQDLTDQLAVQVISLTEKLQAKELEAAGAAAGLKPDDQAASSADHTAVNVHQLKSEDRLSTGSGGSAVVDGEGPPHLVDSSGESYFPQSYHCVGPVDGGVQSEEDDGSDEGCNYYPDGMFAGHHHPDDEAAQLGWWVWG